MCYYSCYYMYEASYMYCYVHTMYGAHDEYIHVLYHILYMG